MSDNRCANKECCCSCINQIKIMCHPNNGRKIYYGFLPDKIKIGKGPINRQLAWGCNAPLEDINKIYYFDSEHEMCELYHPRYLNKVLKRSHKNLYLEEAAHIYVYRHELSLTFDEFFKLVNDESSDIDLDEFDTICKELRKFSIEENIESLSNITISEITKILDKFGVNKE